MNDLSVLPIETLEAMKARLLRWLIALFAIDAVLIVIFVVVLLLKPKLNPVLMVPPLMLPGIFMVPFITRITAIKKELAKRGR